MSTNSLVRHLPAVLFGDLSLHHLKELLSSHIHDLHLSRHRAGTIINRVRLISGCFAFLNLLWVLVDYWVFPIDVWNNLLLMRLAVVAVFIALAWPWQLPKRLSVAFLLLLTMLLNPLLFYLFSQSLFGDQQLYGWAAISVMLYASLPFIVMAGLSVFPLTVVESLLLVLPVVLSLLLGLQLADNFSWEGLLPTLWLMLLVAGVYIISGMIQIHYMIVIVNKVSLDALTGAFTRRSGEEILDLYFHISNRHEKPFAVAFIDLDHFKQINDIYGHDEGDKALRQACANLQQLLRSGDIVIRWGGEEFILLLNGSDIAGAQKVVERITQNWLGKRPDGTALTASMGIAERVNDKAEDWPDLIELADQRMYQAKQSGRARCVFAEDLVVS